MKKRYIASFHTDAEYASTAIDQPHPVNHIEILDEDDTELAHWRDPDLLLRMACSDLFKALEFCEMTLADLEASKRKGYIAEAKKLARTAIAKARSPTTAVWPYL